jgi:hypothetical protein
MQLSNLVLVLVASGALAGNLLIDRVAQAIAHGIARWHARRVPRAPASAPCTASGCP